MLACFIFHEEHDFENVGEYPTIHLSSLLERDIKTVLLPECKIFRDLQLW